MNRKVKIFPFIIIGFIFCSYSCHQNKSLYQEDCDTILSVNLDLEDNTVSFYDLFENVSLLPLETTEESLLSNIDKIIIHNDSIFILDKKQGAIFLFNSEGKYINKLSQQGDGPTEYFDLADFTFNKYTTNLELLSVYRGIYCFNRNFKFIEKFSLPDNMIPVHRFAVIDSCTRVFFNSVRPHKIEVYHLYNKELKGNYFEIPQHIYREASLGGPFLLDNRQDGEAIFTQPFSNTVYSVSPLSFKPHYKWDFGTYNFSVDVLKPGLSQNEYDNLIRNSSFRNSHVFPFTAHIENANFYLAQFGFGTNHGLFTVLFDKKTRKYRKFEKLEEGVSFPHYPIMKEDNIYVIVRDTSIINFYLNDRIKTENAISIENYREDQNPMLLKYKLKKFSF